MITLVMKEEIERYSDSIGNGEGIIVESSTTKGLGASATLLVSAGTVKTGDWFVCGTVYGKVRKLLSDTGVVEIAGPAEPVEVLGWKERPNPGDSFFTVDSEKMAKDVVEYRVKKIDLDFYVKEFERERNER